MEYLVVIEQGADGFSAYVPDLPGCITVGETLDEVQSNSREAIELYLEGLADKHLPIPEPSSQSIKIRIPA